MPITPYAWPGVLGPVDSLGLGAAVVHLVVLAAIVGAAAWWAIRRRDRIALAALGVAVGAVLVALVTLVIMPIGPLGLTPHQMRWLWAIGPFVWFAVLLTAGRGLAERPGTGEGCCSWAASAWRRCSPCSRLPTYVQPAGPAAFAFQIPVVRDLDRQLGDQLAGGNALGTVWFDASNLPLFDNYSAAVLAELQARDVAFEVDEPGLVRQFGDHRRYDPGRGADSRLYLLQGREALTVPDGDTRLALATPLPEAAQAELLTDEDVLVDFAASGGAVLNAAGEAAAAAGTLPVDPTSLATAATDPRRVVASGVLPALVRDGFVDAAADIVVAAVRYAELLTEVNAGTTVAVVASPLPLR